MNVDAVEQGTADAAEVVLDFARETAGFRGHLAVRGAVRCLFNIFAGLTRPDARATRPKGSLQLLMPFTAR